MDRRRAVVHAPWTAAWWGSETDGSGGSAELRAIFGAPPSLTALAATAAARSGAMPPSWTTLLRGKLAHGVSSDALVVVAGQQPILMGGAALVAHKACTAIALARTLEREWRRPVVPVFLLATEDHDSSEVDHVDIWDPSAQALRRLRCPLTPAHDRFAVATLDEAAYKSCYESLEGTSWWRTASGDVRDSRRGALDAGIADDMAGLLEALRYRSSFPDHVEGLLDSTFGPLGLLTVRAHELTARAMQPLEAALSRRLELAGRLEEGALALRQAGLAASFDPADPRPLLLESRAGRRRRLAADDSQAAARLAADPATFSPHAALRPVVQASALPVIAQVCGPSELLYLGQARGLHALLGATAPVLVPRLEATAIPSAMLEAAGGDLRTVLPAGSPPNSPDAAELARHEAALLDAARAFAAAAGALDPAQTAAAERWLRRVERGARRLAERPVWRGRLRQDALSVLRPRGRPQDTVLAWLPDALHHGRPRTWAEHLVSLCRPLEPPAHVLHALPGDARDG